MASAAAATSSASASAGGITTPPRSLPATDVFNYNALPSDIYLHLDQHTDPIVFLKEFEIEKYSTRTKLRRESPR